MRRRLWFSLSLALTASLALAATGCGGGPGGDTGDGGNTDGGNTDGGNGDSGNADSGPSQLGAHTGTTLAAAGTVCTSPNYKLIVTLGQSPGGNVTSQSANFRLRGGVVGATQKP